MPLIEVRGLTKLYRMGSSIVRALDGVDLSIERGEFVAITGASGSGKSTMMHVLGCLDRPTGGQYSLAGRDVSRLSDRELAAIRNTYIGFVFQTFNLINRTNALENVAVPLFYARQANTHAPARRALERVSLMPRAHHNPNELSGGERQRVAIARAIVNDPPLLLADEPTGNLDSRTGAQIMEIFHSLNEQGVTIVMVTHEPDIARHARRIVMMRDGRVLSDRPTAEVIAEEGPLASPTHMLAPGDTESGPPAITASAVGRSDGQSLAHGAELRTAPPDLTPQRMRGCTSSLVCAVLAMLTLAAALATVYTAAQKYDLAALAKVGRTPPKEALVLFGVGFVGFVAQFVLSIFAIALGTGALLRIRSDPGVWTGRWRAWLGLGLGVAAAALSVVMTVINVVFKKG